MDAKGSKADRKKELCFEIAAIVRKVQKKYISSVNGSSTNADLSEEVEHLCGAIEAMFLHELKNSKGKLWRDLIQPNPNIPPRPSFWLFIDPVVSDEIKMQLLALRNSESDVRKCRSWVRLMLAKNMMISFLEDLQRHPGLLAFHYGGGALLRDPEQSEIVIQLLRGLSVLELDYNHTSSKLDTWDTSVLVQAGIWVGPTVGEEIFTSRSTVPINVTSPAHTSPSVQRVSPPTSDFDFEGVSIIDIALNKYSKRKTTAGLSDSQLISREIAERIYPPNQKGRGSDSFSSLDSSSNTSLTTYAEGGTPTKSYGAMLRNYAQRTDTSAPQTATGADTTRQGTEMAGKVSGEGDAKNYSVALSLNYEIIASDGTLVESRRCEQHVQQQSVMMEHLVKLVNEEGLDSQNYKCYGCSRDIGIIFGQAKLCKFNGQHYCYDCHRDDERTIPARVLFNWDFRVYKVCLSSCEFLDSMELIPVLDVAQINQALYRYIPALEDALKLRQQCKYISDYLVTCKEQDVLEQFRKRLKSSHIYEDIHKYSIRELVDVNSGAFNERLRKLVKFGTKHVKQCSLCSQKGFICEVCHDPNVIYPFDLEETSQCVSCKSVYHRVCHPEKGNCPKCLRLRKRADSLTKPPLAM